MPAVNIPTPSPVSLLTTIGLLVKAILVDTEVGTALTGFVRDFEFSGFDPDVLVGIFLAAESDPKVLFLDLMALCVVVSLRGTNLKKMLEGSTSVEGVKKLTALKKKYSIVDNNAEGKSKETLTLNRFCLVFAPMIAEVREVLGKMGVLTPVVESTVCPLKYQFIGAWEVVLDGGEDKKAGYLAFLAKFEAQTGKMTTVEEKEKWMNLAITASSSKTAGREAILKKVVAPYMRKLIKAQEDAAKLAEARVNADLLKSAGVEGEATTEEG